MFEDSELIWPALEMLLKVLGWIFWALVLLWAMGGVLNFPGSQFTLGIVVMVVVLQEHGSNGSTKSEELL